MKVNKLIIGVCVALMCMLFAGTFIYTKLTGKSLAQKITALSSADTISNTLADVTAVHYQYTWLHFTNDHNGEPYLGTDQEWIKFPNQIRQEGHVRATNGSW